MGNTSYVQLRLECRVAVLACLTCRVCNLTLYLAQLLAVVT